MLKIKVESMSYKVSLTSAASGASIIKCLTRRTPSMGLTTSSIATLKYRLWIKVTNNKKLK
jgi:predicted secreted Zn-dependent protease